MTFESMISKGVFEYIDDIVIFAENLEEHKKFLKKNETLNQSEDAERAFEYLKELLCSAPLLQSPETSKPFLITTNVIGSCCWGNPITGQNRK